MSSQLKTPVALSENKNVNLKTNLIWQDWMLLWLMTIKQWVFREWLFPVGGMHEIIFNINLLNSDKFSLLPPTVKISTFLEDIPLCLLNKHKRQIMTLKVILKIHDPVHQKRTDAILIFFTVKYQYQLSALKIIIQYCKKIQHKLNN